MTRDWLIEYIVGVCASSASEYNLYKLLVSLHVNLGFEAYDNDAQDSPCQSIAYAALI